MIESGESKEPDEKEPSGEEQDDKTTGIRDITAREIELVRTYFLEQLRDTIVAYSQIIQVYIPFDLRAALIIAIEKALRQEEIALPEKSVPHHSHPLFRPVLREFSLIAAGEMQARFADGNLFAAVQCLIFSFECARISEFGIPKVIFEYFGKIEAKLTSGGRLENIFLKAKRLIIPSAIESGKVKDEPATEDTDKLKQQSIDLQREEKWDEAIAVLKELIRRKKDILNNQIILSYALENAGRTTDALNLCNFIMMSLFEKSEPYKKNKAHIESLREKLKIT